VLNKIKKVWPLAISALFGFILAAIIFLPKAYSNNQSVYKTLQNKYKDLNQILQYLNHFYFDSVDIDKIMDGAFFGLMEKLDPHSTYIPAKEQESIDEVFKGKFQGIGIEFDILNGFITVISPVPDSPSQVVGLMPGDKITAIDGQDAYKITKDEVFKKLRGKKGTKVIVTISRIGKSKPFDVTIIRDLIPIYSVGAATMIDDETGYIFLRRFSATTKDEVTASLNKLLDKGMKRLLFELL
jgi:carboxyl-terminal processing protease